MTCIAVRDGQMAADSRISGTYNTPFIKITRKPGYLIGFAGDLSQALVFTDWFQSRESRQPDLAEEKGWCALTLSAKGVEYWDCSLRPSPIMERYAAIGSGAPFAIAAMDAGATAKQAVAIAIKRDPGCGLPITTFRLNSSRKGK